MRVVKAPQIEVFSLMRSFFLKGLSKWPIVRKTLRFGMRLHWDVCTTNTITKSCFYLGFYDYF
jgi:hypothetical protein